MVEENAWIGEGLEENAVIGLIYKENLINYDSD